MVTVAEAIEMLENLELGARDVARREPNENLASYFYREAEALRMAIDALEEML